jgi:hypothetical protein
VAVTVVAVYFYLLYDQQVSYTYTGREEELGFKMSEYYAHCRVAYFDKFISDFGIWVLVAFGSSIPLYFITAYAY